MKSNNLIFKLAFIAGVVFVVFLQPLDLLRQNAAAQSFKNTDKKRDAFSPVMSPDLPVHLTPRIEIDKSASPVLQGATCGTIGPPPKPQLVACGGEDISPTPPIQGTISGPLDPLDTSAVLKEQREKKVSIASIFLFSIAASFMMCLLRYLRRSNKNAMWMFGGVAAVLLMITGFIWGNNISF